MKLYRRHDIYLNKNTLKIILGDEHLISDLLTTSEVTLATLGLAYHREHNSVKRPIDVVIDGLGLGYTVEAALKSNFLKAFW